LADLAVSQNVLGLEISCSTTINIVAPPVCGCRYG
jgi:hypothetical protein